ncbi:MAG TPA: hypothetical protein VMR95_02580 [Candidatus Binatia bacterium]|nr:hypothetical protein [Candidatus Binatia bacterium]
MNLSDIIFKNESDPSYPTNHGTIFPVIHELRTNFLANVEVGLSMIEKAYELSTPDTVQAPSGSIEPTIVSANLDELLTETTEAKRQEIVPTVAQVATMAPISLQEARLAKARAAAEAAWQLEESDPVA